MNIKEMVSNGKTVHFVRYCAGNLVYRTEEGFEFPVPINDLGEANINAEEKAILLMRYIRKQIEVVNNS